MIGIVVLLSRRCRMSSLCLTELKLDAMLHVMLGRHDKQSWVKKGSDQ